MLRSSLVILLSVILLRTEAQETRRPVQLKLMTYNLKFASPTFEPSWDVRREMQLRMIRQYNPDIISTQEGLKGQIDWLAEQLNDYVAIGEGRQGGDDDEHMVIFYKKDKFRLRELNSFQLSKTPEVIGSGPEINPRMVTWARFSLIDIQTDGKEGAYPQDYRGHWENNKEFYVFNTHYFDRSDQVLARMNASKLILERINALQRFGEWEDERPVFLMGDFNCRPGTRPYEVLVSHDGSDPDKLQDSSTNHSLIDWILYRGDVEILHYEVVDYNEKGKYPSDHKPIYIEVEIK